MPRSKAWFFLIHLAEPGRDLGQHRSVSAAVIFSLVIGSVVLVLAASQSLDVTARPPKNPLRRSPSRRLRPR